SNSSASCEERQRPPARPRRSARSASRSPSQSVRSAPCWSTSAGNSPSLPTARTSDRVELVETPHGPARVHLHDVHSPRAALALGHGAGGGVESPDLVGATSAASEAGLSVALVEQPYRVAGRRSPAPAGQLDAAWLAVVPELFRDLPLIV